MNEHSNSLKTTPAEEVHSGTTIIVSGKIYVFNIDALPVDFTFILLGGAKMGAAPKHYNGR